MPRKSMTNRWGYKLRVGLPVRRMLARGGSVVDTIESFPPASDFSRAYGPQVTMKSGNTCCASDLKPLRWEFFKASDGDLLRLATSGPKSYAPFRAGFSGHRRDIKTTQDLRATLRAGAHTSHGGYECFLILSDGEELCFACARKEYRQLSRALRESLHDGWRPVNCESVCNTDSRVECTHCNRVLQEEFTEGQ